MMLLMVISSYKTMYDNSMHRFSIGDEVVV